jgi:hypothetical protein
MTVSGRAATTWPTSAGSRRCGPPGDRPWATWADAANADKLIGRSVAPGKLKFKSDDPGLGRGSHPGEWVRYRTI